MKKRQKKLVRAAHLTKLLGMQDDNKVLYTDVVLYLYADETVKMLQSWFAGSIFEFLIPFEARLLADEYEWYVHLQDIAGILMAEGL